MKNHTQPARACVFAALPVLSLFLLGLALPARAGWVLNHYVCTGNSVTSGQALAWPTSGTPGDAYFGDDTTGSGTSPNVTFGINEGAYSYPTTQSESGTIAAVFTWQDPNNYPAPAGTVGVLVTGYASGFGSSGNVRDGFGDPAAGPGSLNSYTSSGSHLVSVSVTAGQTSFTVPATGGYSLRAQDTVNQRGYGAAVSLGAMVCNGSLGGHSTVDTSATGNPWDPTHPRFFSGTGCEATATAVPLSGYLTHAQLCIAENSGDTVVKEYWDNNAPGRPNPIPTNGAVNTGTQLSSASLSAMFDSTHFMDGTPITLKLKVWDSNGGNYSGSVQEPAYNKAYLLVNANAAFAYDPNITSVALALEQRDNYTGHPANDALKIAILDGIPRMTALYFDTHGGPGWLGDCNYVPPPPGTTTVPSSGQGSAAYILSAGNSTVDSGSDVVGQPTISKRVSDKSVTYPPYNFALLYACKTNSDYQLSNAFLAGGGTATYDLSIGASTDRSEVGFVPTIRGDDKTTQWVSAFWDNFTSGKTVLDSVIAANVDHEVTGVSDNNPFNTFPTTGIS